MIRTLIEVTGADEGEHERQLKDMLNNLGFEPKRDEDHIRFMSDLWQALDDRDIKPHQIVEELRAERMRKALAE